MSADYRDRLKDLCADAHCKHVRSVHYFDDSDGSGFCNDCWQDPRSEPFAYHVFDEGVK